MNSKIAVMELEEIKELVKLDTCRICLKSKIMKIVKI